MIHKICVVPTHRVSYHIVSSSSYGASARTTVSPNSFGYHERCSGVFTICPIPSSSTISPPPTLWKPVKMTFTELTVLWETPKNQARTNAIMHTVDINGSNEMNCSWKWMTRDGSCPTMDRTWVWTAAKYRALPDMNCCKIRIAVGYGLHPDMDGC